MLSAGRAGARPRIAHRALPLRAESRAPRADARPPPRSRSSLDAYFAGAPPAQLPLIFSGSACRYRSWDCLLCAAGSGAMPSMLAWTLSRSRWWRASHCTLLTASAGNARCWRTSGCFQRVIVAVLGVVAYLFHLTYHLAGVASSTSTPTASCGARPDSRAASNSSFKLAPMWRAAGPGAADRAVLPCWRGSITTSIATTGIPSEGV